MRTAAPPPRPNAGKMTMEAGEKRARLSRSEVTHNKHVNCSDSPRLQEAPELFVVETLARLTVVLSTVPTPNGPMAMLNPPPSTTDPTARTLHEGGHKGSDYREKRAQQTQSHTNHTQSGGEDYHSFRSLIGPPRSQPCQSQCRSLMRQL